MGLRSGAARSWALALTVGVLASGCRNDAEEQAPARRPLPPPSEPASQPSSPAAPSEPPPPPSPLPSRSVRLDAARAELHLLANGDAPRRALRYRLGPLRRRFQVVERLSPTLTVDSRRVPGSPAMSVEATGTLTLDAPDAATGRSPRELFIERLLPTSGSLGSEDLVRLQGRFASFEGSSVRDSMGPRGDGGAIELRLSTAPGHEVEEFLTRLGVGAFPLFPEFPEEALGRGARFALLQERSADGVRVRERTEFELTRVEGAKLWLRVTQEQRAEAQPLPAPAGASARLESLRGSLSGQLELELEALDARGRLSGQLQLETTQESQGAAPTRSRLQTAVQLTTRIEP